MNKMDTAFRKRQEKLFEYITTQVKPEMKTFNAAVKSVKKRSGLWRYVKLQNEKISVIVPLSSINLESLLADKPEKTTYTFTVLDMTDKKYEEYKALNKTNLIWIKQMKKLRGKIYFE